LSVGRHHDGQLPLVDEARALTDIREGATLAATSGYSTSRQGRGSGRGPGVLGGGLVMRLTAGPAG